MWPQGRLSARRLAELLGDWRAPGVRSAANDLAAGIRLLVLDGRLPSGTGLPAERELADALGASRTMVGAALRRLRADGLVASRQGSGSWITIPGTVIPVDPPPGADLIDMARAAPGAIAGTGAALDRVRGPMADMVRGHGYSEQGLPGLREQIAERYAARGLPTDPEQIVVTSGAHHAFVLVLRMLAGPGDRVLVEQPTYPNALDAIRAAGAIPVPVPLADDGWPMGDLEAALRQTAPRLAYLIVDFQNPTGLRMDAASRRELATALRRARTTAVIDETLVDLDLDLDDDADVPPVATFAGDRAITIGSASKSHWGGLRLGWIRASHDQVHQLLAARNGLDLGSAVLDQLLLAELLRTSETALRARRIELARGRDVLAAAITEHLPGWTFRVPSGGLGLWCRLPTPASTRLAVAARDFGVRVVPGPRFGVHGLERWLRLPYSLPQDELCEAVRRLAAAAQRVVDGSDAMSDAAETMSVV
jgi:DNA-binding transcriptional MocR family regulator